VIRAIIEQITEAERSTSKTNTGTKRSQKTVTSIEHIAEKGMKYKDEVVLRYPLKNRIKRCLGLRVGKLIDRLKFYLPVESLGRRFINAHKYYLTKKGYDDYYNKYASNNRLTDEQIENIVQYQVQVYSKSRHEYFEKNQPKIQFRAWLYP